MHSSPSIQKFSKEVEMSSSDDGPGVGVSSPRDPANGKSAPAGGIFEQIAQRTAPTVYVLFRHDDTRVFDDMGYFATVAGNDGNTARKRFNHHPAQLFAPARQRLARGAQNIHRIEKCGYLFMMNSGDDSNAIGIAKCPVA